VLVVCPQRFYELPARPGEQLRPAVGVARMDAALVAPTTQLHERVGNERMVEPFGNCAVVGEATQLGGSVANRGTVVIAARGLVRAPHPHRGSKWTRAVSVCVDGLDKIEHGAKRHLATSARCDDDWHVANRDPAVERRLAHPQQSSRRRTADGRTGRSLQVGAHGYEIFVGRMSVVGTPQPHGVTHQMFLVKHGLKLVRY
jgi:hypothetical protein